MHKKLHKKRTKNIVRQILMYQTAAKWLIFAAYLNFETWSHCCASENNTFRLTMISNLNKLLISGQKPKKSETLETL